MEKNPTSRHIHEIENTNPRKTLNFQNQATYKDSGIITTNDFQRIQEVGRQWNDASEILM